ncbi:phospholipase D-like domain-containing protein [Pedobacter xixiisoli]|uniref:phospholipase D n=1 Tax=Pedobacter xixiisoli TaxID=1476464 RepID=A0A285ZVZ0_9SPHI|nr:phospholipase D-like domain-containing protein [Pedobacter xixiisoli]SOD13818.1 Por secretion system C-terminal sorting domain-containing protein [Pedobacter xixiisoli]
MKKNLLKLSSLLLLLVLQLVGTKGSAQVNISFPEVAFTDVKSIAKGSSSSVIMNRLIALVDNTPAGESIYISIYMINYQPLMDALKNAETRGVNLHIIVDMSRSDPQVTNATSLPWLQSNLANSEIIVTTNDVSTNAINHHKHALFSGVNTTSGLVSNVTFQTSHNFTNSDMGKIQDALIFNEADIYQVFLANWNVMKQNASSGMRLNFVYTAHDFAAINTKLAFFPRIVAGVYDGGDNILENLNAITDVPNAKIRIAMSDWTDSRPAIVDKLIALRNQGATIEVYAKDAAGTQTKAKLNQLKTLGATVRIFNLSTDGQAVFNIHAKMMLIEGTWNGQPNVKVILTGSHNYTDGALKTNNEVLVTLINSPLFNTYDAYFNSLSEVLPTLQLLAWNFNTLNTTGSEISNLSTQTSGGLFNATLLRGTGFKVNGLSKGMGSVKDQVKNTTISTTRAMAVANEDYFEFNVSPKPGKKLILNNLEYVVRRSSTASPKTGAWMYVVEENGVKGALQTISTADITFTNGPTLSAGFQQAPIDLSQVQELQNIGFGKKVYLRLYFWGATTLTSTFGLGPYGVNNNSSVILNGDVMEDDASAGKILAGWQFATSNNGSNAAGNELAYAASTTVGIENTTMSRGAGLKEYELVRGFSSVPEVLTPDKQAAVDGNSYLEFKLKPKANYTLTLATLYAKMRRSANGGAKSAFRWMYSVDGTNFTPLGTSDDEFVNNYTEGLDQPSIDLSGVAALQQLQNNQEVTFRLYVWGFTAGVGTGTFAIGRSKNGFDDALFITGTATYNDPLPVTLTKFEAKKTNSAVTLSWTTASEQNNSHFEVLKLADGIGWNVLTTVKGIGNSNQVHRYAAHDTQPFLGTNYYQLKQVDVDGKSTLSKVLVVDFKLADVTKLAASYRSSVLTVNTNGFSKGNAKITLYDITGKTLAAQSHWFENGSNTISIPASLQSGVYVLTVSTPTEREAIKILVQY